MNDTPGAHNKNKPEIEARVSKIDVPSTWNLLDGTTSNNIYGGPDAAVSVYVCIVITIMFYVNRF